MSLGDIGISTINGGAIGVKNAIINGNFAVNQRGVSGTVTLAAGAYGHDRFKAGASGCTYTFATANNITTLTISAGSLIQVIEGNNLFTGTYTLSWTGTAQGKIGGGSYASSGVTGTPAGGSNLNIEFNTGTLSLVQFEPGSVATPFERRPFGQELALCQRYLPAYTGDTNILANGSGFDGNNTRFRFVFPVQTRVPPTGVVVSSAGHFQVQSGVGSFVACSSLAFGQAGVNGAAVGASHLGGGATNASMGLFSNNASAILYFTGCEL